MLNFPVLTPRLVQTIHLLLISPFLLLGACDSLKSYTDVEYVQRAKQFRDKGDLQASIIELKNALQKNAKNADARWMLGDVYAIQGLGREAEKELKLAEDLGVNRESLKVSLGTALLQQGEFNRLLKEIEPSANSSKANTSKILVIRGQAQIALRDLDQGCATILQSVGFDPTYIPAYLNLARCEALKGHPDAARKEVDKALKLDPKSTLSLTALGNLDTSQGRYTEAEKAYTEALDIQADNIEALISRASARIQMKKLTEASKDIDAILKIKNNHPIANHLRGVVQFREGKYGDAKTSFESVLKQAPAYSPSILWLGLANYAQQNFEQAASNLNLYVRREPGAVKVRALLALLQARTGNRKEALESLRVIGESVNDDPGSLAAIGEANLLLGDPISAERYFVQVVERNPKDPEGRFNLARALIQNAPIKAIEQLEIASQLDPGSKPTEALLLNTLVAEKQYDRALARLDVLEKQDPKSAFAPMYRGQILWLQNRRDAAETEFKRALAIEPGDPSAAHSLALIALNNQNFDHARGYYQQVLDRHQDHLLTMMALYRLETEAKRPRQARKILEAAAQKHPKAPSPAVALGRIYLAEGQPLKALEVTREAAAAEPDRPELLDLRGDASLAANDAGNALASFRKLVQIVPKSPDALVKLGMAQAALNDADAMRGSLEQALNLDPNHIAAKTALARAYVLQGKSAQALKLAKELSAQNESAIHGLLLEAEVLSQQGKVAEVIEPLEHAKQLSPQSDNVVFSLARAYARAGNEIGAFAVVDGWRKTHPADPRPALFIGDVYLATGREKEALVAYENSLKLAPGNVSALNNLAWLNRKQDSTKAIEYAERAVKLSQEAPMAIDTLGMIYLESGNAKKATELLKKAFDNAPNATDIHLHYIQALAQAGEKEVARRELSRLLGTGKKFAQEQEARELQKQL